MDNPQFPEYGDGGDLIGARRMRRAFRWCAMAIFLFTVMLWFSENFLRYEHAERLYLAALTKDPEAGRNFLRQAVVHDRAKSEFPTPKYVEALAEREEDDLILPTYDEAYKLDTGNSTLAIRYGCRLFHDGQVASARLRFREAADLAPKNLLPIYLEASVVPWLEAEEEDLESAMVLVERANETNGIVTFPRPLWSSALPQSGYWYASLCRRVADDCSQPLYRFSSLVFSRAENEITEGTLEPWVRRLESMRRMATLISHGAIVSGRQGGTELATAGASQVYLGFTLIGRALEQEKRIHEKSGTTLDEDLSAFAAHVKDGLTQIQQFEARRQDIVQDELEKYRFPIRLSLKTLFFIVCWYFLVYLACKILRVSSTSHNVPHSATGRIVLGLWAGTVLALLAVVAVVQHSSVGEMPGFTFWTALWWTLTACFVVFGLVYPRLALVRVPDALAEALKRNLGPVSEAEARRSYRAAYFSLSRRYLGILFGVTVAAVCIWAVIYRVLLAVYPWEVELLAVGLRAEELELVRSLLAILG
jgi:tetratricopeptide (TPR) repeat protein